MCVFSCVCVFNHYLDTLKHITLPLLIPLTLTHTSHPASSSRRQLAKTQELRNRERESIATPGSRPATSATPGVAAGKKRVLGL